IIGGEGDAVPASKINGMILVCIRNGIDFFPFYIVSVKRGNSIRINGVSTLALIVIVGNGKRITRSAGINGFIFIANSIGIGLGPFIGATVGVWFDGKGVEPPRSASTILLGSILILF